jgi:hypothetical protein
MAIDFSQYAKSYAGDPRVANAGATLGKGLGNIFSKIPTPAENFADYQEASLNETFANIYDIDGKFSIDAIKNLSPGTAYTSFTDLLKSKRPIFQKRMKKKGFLSPQAFRKSFNERVAGYMPEIVNSQFTGIYKDDGSIDLTKIGNIGQDKGALRDIPGFREAYSERLQRIMPDITSKVKLHQIMGKKSNKKMREFLSAHPELQQFLLLNSQDPMILDWAAPRLSYTEELGRTFEDVEDWVSYNPVTTILGTGAVLEAGRRLYPKVKDLAKKYPGAAGPYSALLPQYAMSKGFGTAARKSMPNEGSKRARLVGEVAEIAGTGTMYAIQRVLRDKPWWVMKTILKKSPALAGRTIAKIVFGLAGGGVSGGVISAAMLAWTAKDFYDIVQILQEEDTNIK